MPRKKMNRGGRPSLLARLSIAELTGEIDRRWDELLAQRAEIENELAQLGSDDHQPRRRGPGRPPGSHSPKLVARRGGAPSRGRGGNKQSLPALLQSLLRGKTMGVQGLAQAAKKAGHKSKSKNFRVPSSAWRCWLWGPV